MEELQAAKMAAGRFLGENVQVRIILFGSGHIHQTYLVEKIKQKEIQEESKRWILQKINTNVFPNPESMMENILLVTKHIKKSFHKTKETGEQKTLTVCDTTDGKSLAYVGNQVYRMYEYIEESISFDVPSSKEMLYESGKVLGRFLKMTGDLKQSLTETIPEFHNTPNRFLQMEQAVIKDVAGRKNKVEEWITFAEQRKEKAKILQTLKAAGKLPLRITHNDTKLNNFLFDKKTKKGLCLIDLDTVMMGLSAWDFGDALRTGAAKAKEDETDLTKVKFCFDYYEAFLHGYLEEAGEILTPEEYRVLPVSVWVMTLECGVRFLTDYLSGDVYFKTSVPEQNYNRCKAQFALVKDIEQKKEQMEQLIL